MSTMNTTNARFGERRSDAAASTDGDRAVAGKDT